MWKARWEATARCGTHAKYWFRTCVPESDVRIVGVGLKSELVIMHMHFRLMAWVWLVDGSRDCSIPS